MGLYISYLGYKITKFTLITLTYHAVENKILDVVVCVDEYELLKFGYDANLSINLFREL